jgi:hypothetical protein
MHISGVHPRNTYVLLVVFGPVPELVHIYYVVCVHVPGHRSGCSAGKPKDSECIQSFCLAQIGMERCKLMVVVTSCVCHGQS